MPAVTAAGAGAAAPRPGHACRERGSVMPLVIGMVVCLLLLGAGVTAATSGFLARSRLQHSCDGAASAAADAAQRTLLLTGTAAGSDIARAAALEYLRPRDPTTEIAAGQPAAGEVGSAVELTCTGRAAITFGALFGVPVMTLSVRAVGRSLLPAGGN